MSEATTVNLELLPAWTARRTPTIMSGLVIRFQRKDEQYFRSPEISASRDGVCFAGTWPVMGLGDVSDVKQLLDYAVAIHLAIRADGHDAMILLPPGMSMQP